MKLEHFSSVLTNKFCQFQFYSCKFLYFFLLPPNKFFVHFFAAIFYVHTLSRNVSIAVLIPFGLLHVHQAPLRAGAGVDFLPVDCCQLPFRTGPIDVIVTDLPPGAFLTPEGGGKG